jgi:hypothetical protein
MMHDGYTIVSCFYRIFLSGKDLGELIIKRQNMADSKLINNFHDKFTIENFFW